MICEVAFPVRTCSSFQHRREPSKQVCTDFVAVDLIEHFVSSTGVEVVRDVVDARFAIAIYQQLNSFELLTHWVFAA